MDTLYTIGIIILIVGIILISAVLFREGDTTPVLAELTGSTTPTPPPPVDPAIILNSIYYFAEGGNSQVVVLPRNVTETDWILFTALADPITTTQPDLSSYNPAIVAELVAGTKYLPTGFSNNITLAVTPDNYLYTFFKEFPPFQVWDTISFTPATFSLTLNPKLIDYPPIVVPTPEYKIAIVDAVTSVPPTTNYNENTTVYRYTKSAAPIISTNNVFITASYTNFRKFVSNAEQDVILNKMYQPTVPPSATATTYTSWEKMIGNGWQILQGTDSNITACFARIALANGDLKFDLANTRVLAPSGVSNNDNSILYTTGDFGLLYAFYNTAPGIYANTGPYVLNMYGSPDDNTTFQLDQTDTLANIMSIQGYQNSANPSGLASLSTAGVPLEASSEDNVTTTHSQGFEIFDVQGAALSDYLYVFSNFT